MSSTVGTKGQVVIKKSIRDALGIGPGFLAVQALKGDHLEIRFFPPAHERSLKGVLAQATTRSVSRDEWTSACQEAWAASVSGALERAEDEP